MAEEEKDEDAAVINCARKKERRRGEREREDAINTADGCLPNEARTLGQL